MSGVLRSAIRSCGAYLPRRIVTNKDLETLVETTDEWIVQRTGIHARHIAEGPETTGFMAAAAARQALDRAGLSPSDIDGGVIVATSTPDTTMPNVACRVQVELGLPQGMAMDVGAACGGFMYALVTADALIRAGQGRRFLVIGAEKFSAILDWSDRRTCVLFGDGAGAVVLEACEGRGDLKDRGVLCGTLHANGALRDILGTSGGVGTTGNSGKIIMEGQEVFRYAVRYMSEVVDETLAKAGLSAGDVDWLVPHQANIRIIEATARKLALPMERVVVALDRHGNTSAASIPLALSEALYDGRIKAGDLVVFEALGAGLTWGAALVRM